MTDKHMNTGANSDNQQRPLIRPPSNSVRVWFGHWRRGWGAGLALLFGLGVVPTSVFAQFDAFSIEVAVVDRSRQEQQSAYLVAMRRILLQNSGDKTLLNRDDVRAGLGDAEQYVESFRYRAPEPGTLISSDTPITDQVRRSGEATQLMLVSFDATRIRALIKGNTPDDPDAEVAASPLADIRNTLVWMLVEDGSRDILVTGDSHPTIVQRSREIAGGAGVNLTFPSGTADVLGVTADDIREDNREAIVAASDRYSRPVITIAHIKRAQPTGWTAVWTRFAGDETESADIESDNLDGSLQQGFQWLNPAVPTADTGQPTYQFGSTGASVTEAMIWFSSVNDTAAYADIMRLLDSVASVDAVYPKEVSPAGMAIAVVPRGALTAVGDAIAQTSWLRQTSLPVSAEQSSIGRYADFAVDYLR